ncbi:MAG: potassium channel protein [Actinobacteria bacterium]|nr:potassium channel protein [Actinomycetota bacterium]
MSPWRRVWIGLAALVGVIGIGTLGYWVLGLSPLDALYQSVTTISTVGFRELYRLTTASKVFTILLILFGVGTALYSFGVLIEALLEGQLAELLGRKKMDRRIGELKDHVIICGWGRVGRAIADHLAAAGQEIIIVDLDASRLTELRFASIAGDATEDSVLKRAGIDRARALAAVTANDATNLYLTLSGRSLKPELFILARARVTDSEAKLLRAGADRVVNPQAIGGARAAALLLQPHVAEFVDVITHGIDVEFRLAELEVSASSALAGKTLREARIRDLTGALILAMRQGEGNFITNPSPDSTVSSGEILIAIGTAEQLSSLERLATTATSKPA